MALISLDVVVEDRNGLGFIDINADHAAFDPVGPLRGDADGVTAALSMHENSDSGVETVQMGQGPACLIMAGPVEMVTGNSVAEPGIGEDVSFDAGALVVVDAVALSFERTADDIAPGAGKNPDAIVVAGGAAAVFAAADVVVLDHVGACGLAAQIELRTAVFEDYPCLRVVGNDVAGQKGQDVFIVVPGGWGWKGALGNVIAHPADPIVPGAVLQLDADGVGRPQGVQMLCSDLVSDDQIMVCPIALDPYARPEFMSDNMVVEPLVPVADDVVMGTVFQHDAVDAVGIIDGRPDVFGWLKGSDVRLVDDVVGRSGAFDQDAVVPVSADGVAPA